MVKLGWKTSFFNSQIITYFTSLAHWKLARDFSLIAQQNHFLKWGKTPISNRSRIRSEQAGRTLRRQHDQPRTVKVTEDIPRHHWALRPKISSHWALLHYPSPLLTCDPEIWMPLTDFDIDTTIWLGYFSLTLYPPHPSFIDLNVEPCF